MPDFSIGRVLREPLFHFFLLGLGIFALYGWINPDGLSRGTRDRIVIDTQDVNRLVQQYEATWRRPPRQSSMEAGWHEQTPTARLQDQELALRQ